MAESRVILLKSDSFGIHSYYHDLSKKLGYEVCVYPNLIVAYFKNIRYRGTVIIQTKSAILGLFFRKKHTVLVLHGYIGLFEYSFYQWLTKNLLLKIVSMRSEVWSNSYVTASINQMMWSIESIKIVYPNALVLQEKLSSQRKIEFLFVGRNTRAKNIELCARIVHEYNCLTGSKARLTVVSDSLPVSYHDLIDYRGQLDRKEIMKIMRNTIVFISLNPLEPYGIVYEEALSNGCFVVAPVHSGFFEKNYRNPMVVGVASNDAEDVARAILKSIV